MAGRKKDWKPWLSLAKINKYEPLMRKLGVSKVARGKRGFLRAYRSAGGKPAQLDYDDYSGQHWRDRRNAFVSRHMGQIEAKDEPLWDKNGNPTRRHLALIAWAYSPDARKL